jgi:hypothetical protein
VTEEGSGADHFPGDEMTTSATPAPASSRYPLTGVRAATTEPPQALAHRGRPTSST